MAIRKRATKRKPTKKQVSVTITITDEQSADELCAHVNAILGDVYSVQIVYGVVNHNGKTYSHRDFDFDKCEPLPTAVAFGDVRGNTVKPQAIAGPPTKGGISKSEKDATGSWAGAKKVAKPAPKTRLTKKLPPQLTKDAVPDGPAPTTKEIDAAASSVAASSADALKKRLKKKVRG